MILHLKRNLLFKLFFLLFSIFILFCPISTNASVTDFYHPLEVGDILTYQSSMTNTNNWTVDTFYYGSYVSIDILKEDMTFYAEVTGIYSKIVNVQFSFKSSITTDSYRVDKFLVYSILDLLDNNSIPNTIVNFYEEEVVLIQTETNLSTRIVYDRFSHELLNYTSYDNEGRSFNMLLKSHGKGIFGIYPDGSNILSLYWNIGFGIFIGAFILKTVPDKGYFKKIKIRGSVFDTLWFRALLVEEKEILNIYQKEKRLISPRHIELVILTFIAIISNVFYRIVSFACDTYGVIQFWPLFWGFLVVEIVRAIFWIAPAILFSLILQNKKLNPLKIEFFSIKTISRVFLYFYSAIMFLYFFSSWLLTFDRDRAELQLPMYYYGSLTQSFTPLLKFAASVWNQMGWLLLLFWLFMMFVFIIRTFTRPTTDKLQIYTLKESNFTEKAISLSLRIFPLIWIISTLVFEFYIIAELIYILMGI